MSIFTKVPPKTVFYALCAQSPAGKLLIGLTEKDDLCRVSFAEKQSVRSLLQEWGKEWPETEFVKTDKNLNYSECEKKKILLVGTDFQHKVWRGLMDIPAGKTLSYGQLAAHIGNPKAARAVGGACGKNPVPLLVPCHRIIASNGGVGGFSSELTIKMKLLKNEK